MFSKHSLVGGKYRGSDEMSLLLVFSSYFLVYIMNYDE